MTLHNSRYQCKSAQCTNCQLKIYRIKNWLLVKLIGLAVHSTEMVMVKWWCVLLGNKWQCIRWLLICVPTMLGGQYRCNSNTYNFHLRRKDTLVYNFHALSSLVYNSFSAPTNVNNNDWEKGVEDRKEEVPGNACYHHQAPSGLVQVSWFNGACTPWCTLLL